MPNMFTFTDERKESITIDLDILEMALGEDDGIYFFEKDVDDVKYGTIAEDNQKKFMTRLKRAWKKTGATSYYLESGELPEPLGDEIEPYRALVDLSTIESYSDRDDIGIPALSIDGRPFYVTPQKFSEFRKLMEEKVKAEWIMIENDSTLTLQQQANTLVIRKDAIDLLDTRQDKELVIVLACRLRHLVDAFNGGATDVGNKIGTQIPHLLPIEGMKKTVFLSPRAYYENEVKLARQLKNGKTRFFLGQDSKWVVEFNKRDEAAWALEQLGRHAKVGMYPRRALWSAPLIAKPAP